MKSPAFQQTQTIHVWYIYLHLVDFDSKCRSWMVWDVSLEISRFFLAHFRQAQLPSGFFGSSDMNHLPSAAVHVLHHPAVVVTAAAVGFVGDWKKKHQRKLYQHIYIYIYGQKNNKITATNAPPVAKTLHPRTPQLSPSRRWLVWKVRSFIVVKCSTIAAIGV